jgi:hypothetical protein
MPARRGGGEAKHPNLCAAQSRMVTALVSILVVAMSCAGRFTQVSQVEREQDHDVRDCRGVHRGQGPGVR